MQQLIGSPPIAMLGIPIDNVTPEEVLSRIEDWIAEGRFHQLATANTDFLIRAAYDEELKEILRRCDLVVADGMPLIWTSRALRTPLKARVTGVDLVPRIAALSAARGYRLFLLGSSPENLERAAASLRLQYPGVSIVGTLSPPHAPLEAMDHPAILRAIADTRPDILLVAFGNPKQEKWISMHRRRLEVPVAIGVGGTFDVLSGSVARAPRWMQRMGLEWLYRTFQEPRRLAGRYAGNALGLLRHLPEQMAIHGTPGRQSRLAQLSVETAEEASILRLTGDFTGPVIQRFAAEARRAFDEGAHVVLDLSQSRYIGPDALGLLIRVLRYASILGRELWLAGMHPAVERAVRLADLGSTLHIARGLPDALRRIEPASLGWVPARDPRVLAFRAQSVPLSSVDAFRTIVQGTSAITPAPNEISSR